VKTRWLDDGSFAGLDQEAVRRCIENAM